MVLTTRRSTAGVLLPELTGGRPCPVSLAARIWVLLLPLPLLLRPLCHGGKKYRGTSPGTFPGQRLLTSILRTPHNRCIIECQHRGAQLRDAATVTHAVNRTATSLVGAHHRQHPHPLVEGHIPGISRDLSISKDNLYQTPLLSPDGTSGRRPHCGALLVPSSSSSRRALDGAPRSPILKSLSLSTDATDAVASDVLA